MSEDPQIISLGTETVCGLLAQDKKSYESRRKQNDNGKVVRFRCDFPSTQVKVMLARGWTQIVDVNDTSWHLWWCETMDVRQALDRKLEPYQKIPHFRNYYELTRKNFLCRNMKRYKKFLMKAGKIAEAEICDSMPMTFELPNDYRMFVEEYYRQELLLDANYRNDQDYLNYYPLYSKAERISYKLRASFKYDTIVVRNRRQQGATWIVKPAARSQGKGIFLFRKLKNLIEWKSKESRLQEPGMPTETYVVQRYVDNPYLVSGRKFDLRIYVLVTSFHPLKVWLAREGFARLCGRLFDLKNIEDCRVHLTNMAIQLKASQNANSSMDEETKCNCKWALTKLIDYLMSCHERIVVETLIQRITAVIMASLLAVQPVMIQEKNCFELYGYDVLLSEDLQPWLLEVNASPALIGTDSEDRRLKFDLVDDVLNILDFEGRFSGQEIRIGGFDLLWDNGPVWTTCSYPGIREETMSDGLKRLNIFLGAVNDRQQQLSLLREQLVERHKIAQNYSATVQYSLK